MRGFISTAWSRSATPMPRPAPTGNYSPRPHRIARQMAIEPDQPFVLTEFLKPGVEEFCSVLPPWLARPILALAEHYPRLARAHWGMEINTASITGFARFAMLAKLRRFRPHSWRYHAEQREIEN